MTAIARDGTLDGPDLRLYRQVLGLTARPVIASGGVRTAEDVWELRDIGCEAAVTGKALMSRRQAVVPESAVEEQRFPWEPRPED